MQDFLAARAEHVRSAPPGATAAKRLCEMTDEAVRELTRAASSRPSGRWAVIALGGWGAGALQPRSDLDILVLSDAPSLKLEPFVQAVLYPLWDAGLKVGHQVRSPRQQLASMRTDLKTCTAALTARPIAGDLAWAQANVCRWVAEIAKRPRAILGELRTRKRPGSPYLLEPDLKEGAGGRRDFDELVWTSALLSGHVRHEVDLECLTPAELAVVTQAAEVVATARWELQRRGYGDTMTLDAADDLQGVDPQAVQDALGATAAILAVVRNRLDGSEPDDAPMTAAAVFAALEAGESSLAGLETRAQRGHLDALAPGYSSLMTLRRPGLGHELTVGAHSLTSACLVCEPGADGLLSRSLAESDPRVLQVAALAHDVGKRAPGPGHAERGAPEAFGVARRFGLARADSERVADLVRLHLVLAQSAQRDNLDDENAVLATAARVGRRDLVAPLHALTAADSRATGTSTWTPWTAALTATLVSRLDAALSEDVDGAGLVTRAEAVRAEALASLSPDRDAERAFVQASSLRYLASRTPAQVLRHAALVAELSASAATGALVAVSPGPAAGTHEVTVVAPDRPQLLARLAGAMALAGLDILSVDAYGGPGGVALDSFVVTSATRRPVSTETFTALERLVHAALRDRLELAVRLAERRRHYPQRSVRPISVKTTPGGWDTLVEVTAPDRPGLLHDIAVAVGQAGLDIRWASAHTIDGVARDAFHVVGPDGARVDDPGVLGHVAMHIRDSL